ncbi:MAG: ADP-ribosylglycohydrolase family protein [Chloroflexi bacterium]|nr:ADP-ribosylglycohydrolase family protein [Chloroflexota bacterium]
MSKLEVEPLTSTFVITSERELLAATERIKELYGMVLRARNESGATQYESAISVLLSELDRIQLAVREYAKLHPSMMALRDRFAGCLLGAAIGDALGAPLRKMSWPAIRSKFGPNGLECYAPAFGRKGAITWHTQLMLFTVEGLIRAITRDMDKGVCSVPHVVYRAYLRWMDTQGEPFKQFMGFSEQKERDGWLIKVPQLHHRRDPSENTLRTLRSIKDLENPGNHTKGCGALTRSAPCGLWFESYSMLLAIELAKITSGHPTGYLAAAFFACLIDSGRRDESLERGIATALDKLRGEAHHEECATAVEAALRLAETEPATPENIHRLGDGSQAHEALSIALFCALKAQNFDHGVIHGGASSATASLTGALLGTFGGRQSISNRWLDELELRDVIETLAIDYFDYVYRYNLTAGGAEQAEYHNRYPGW